MTDSAIRPAPIGDEPSSPVCYAAHAPDLYMGFLDHEALVAELNVLLEAQRAGARVVAQLATDARQAELRVLARTIQRDNARWSRLLIGALRALGAEPSQAVGGFYEQAMSVVGVEARFAFVNRGQAWVARKLKSLLPKVRDDQLHGVLLGMMAAQHHAIEQAQATLAAVTFTRRPDIAPGES